VEKRPRLGRGSVFPTTRPSALIALASPDPAVAARSLQRIAQIYWRPVYKYVRLRWSKTPEEADEATQEFFLKLIEAGTLGDYDPARGRFRPFFRTCLDRFLLDANKHRLTQKRGGHMLSVPVDVDTLEAEIRGDNLVLSDPEQFFEDEWARSLVRLAADGLRVTCKEKGKEEHFRAFELCYLNAGAELSYAAIAAELGMSLHDATNRLAYARREFRAAVLEALRELTSSERELREEARMVLGVELGRMSHRR
jgi:RNA polymerase sigma-70 factor (ECF subfamily)